MKIEEGYKTERYRYNKANFEDIRNYFETVRWRCFEDEEDLQEKWNKFIEIYNTAVEKYVPKERVNYKTGKEWYNAVCDKARQGKINA